MPSKKPWQSKSIWAALIVAVAAFIPQVSAWIAASPEMFSMALGGVFAMLRLISGSKINID